MIQGQNMVAIGDLINLKYFLILEVIIIILLVISLSKIIISTVKRRLLQKATSKHQVSNIKIFTRMMNMTLYLVIILFAIFSFTGSLAGFGVVAGLLTAALGFALQKPITGIAAWIMVIVKRPFNIGDRIKIGEVKGEVYDISLTHIYIDEVGGLINTEELSGRNIMVPNYLLFEQSIINYTMINEYVLGEVETGITYESNLGKAMEIVEKIALKHTKEHIKSTKKELKIRVSMDTTGVKIKSRFFAPVKSIQKISSDITQDILLSISKQKDIKFASTYPPK